MRYCRDHAVPAASRKRPSFAVARNCGIGSISLNADVNAFDSLHMVLDSNCWCLENDIFGVEVVDRCAPPLRIVFTEDVVKIAGQQGRYTVGHGCWFSSLDRVPLALMY